MKQLIVLLTILISVSTRAQSVGNATSTAIDANFSTVSIVAYQQSAALKIVDYYNYLELLSSEATSDDLKVEVKKALLFLVKSNNIEVVDFTSENDISITLQELIEKIESKNYTFSVLDSKTDELQRNSWSINYRIAVIQNENRNIKTVSQKVYFSQTTKRFGTKTKEIWTITLGEVNAIDN